MNYRSDIMIDIARDIELLLKYAIHHQLIDVRDRLYCRNALLELFKLDSPINVIILESEVPLDISVLLN